MTATTLFSEPVKDPATIAPITLTLSADSPRSRGEARGRQAAEGIARAVAKYSALFTASGIAETDQRSAAEASLDSLQAWDAVQFEELTGVAGGTGLELWQLGIVVARTEILALAAVDPLECSTLAYSAPGRSCGVQTWDWHAEFADIWHYQEVAALPGRMAHTGFAEYGMLGKIGLNSAGVGVMLNILKNRDDATGGVPVHGVLDGVLEQASTVAQAVELIESAPTTSSSVITVYGPDEVVMVEIGPAGKAVLQLTGPGTAGKVTGETFDGAPEGFLVHTNHFLAPILLEGAVELSAESMSQERLELIESRLADQVAPDSTADLLPLMCTGEGEAPVCRTADPNASFGSRLATLVTVQIDPVAGSVTMNPGSPADSAPTTTLQVERE